MKRLWVIAMAAACLGAVAPLDGATTSKSLAVSATVVDTCSVSATALNFGPVFFSAVNATATVTLKCTSGTQATIGLDAGRHSSHASGGMTRAMESQSGGYYLSYDVYKDSGHTAVWGDHGGATVTAMGTGAPQTLAAYCHVPSGQFMEAAVYSDSVTITVTY